MIITSVKNIEELKIQLETHKQISFKIKAVANSKNNSVEFLDEYIKVKINQKAIDGKANKAIIEYFSEILKIAKSKIEIVNGEKSSIKTLSANL